MRDRDKRGLVIVAFRKDAPYAGEQRERVDLFANGHAHLRGDLQLRRARGRGHHTAGEPKPALMEGFGHIRMR